MQASVGVNYAISKTISAKFGYRYLKVDYDKDGGLLYDMEMQGTQLGVGFRF
jgi:opacity protein-like surface antigen